VQNPEERSFRPLLGAVAYKVGECRLLASREFTDERGERSQRQGESVDGKLYKGKCMQLQSLRKVSL